MLVRIFILSILLLGCEDSKRITDTRFDFNDLKYNRCQLLLELRWSSNNIYENKKKLVKILKDTDKVYKSNFQTYFFSSSYIVDDNLVYVFYENCKNRETMLGKYVKTFLNEINDFPKYEIKPILNKDSLKINIKGSIKSIK